MTSRRILSFVLAACFLSACARNYITRRHELHLIREKTEIEIGKKAKIDIVKEYGQYNDLQWQIYIDQIGQKVAKASDRPNLPYDFTILDTDIINAFAVPGGKVFITRGILMQMADEAELAVVLGHEITHIAGWHGIELLQRAGMLSTLTAIGAIGGIALGAGEAAIAIAQAAGVYENLYLLGYGRQHELDADQHGIRYAARAGYDPEAALTFFKRLDAIEKEETAGQHISPYWKTHPDTEVRSVMAREWIGQIKSDPPAITFNRDKYQDMVRRLPRGESTAKGTVKGNAYQNPGFGVSLEVPQGWVLDNSRLQSVVGFVGPIPEVRGALQRHKLAAPMGVAEFSKQIAKQWGLQDPVAREVDYPSGHGLMWQYGDNYLHYRALLMVRENIGYTLTCQAPADQYFQYVVDCEKIMRSLQIQ